MSIIAKYKYNKSIYEDLIPTFNDGYTGYSISDEIDSENSNHVIRTIECDTLPTRIQFGQYNTSPRTQDTCLIGIEYLDVSNVDDLNQLFARCINLQYINGITEWDTSKVTRMEGMFYNCQSLTSLDVSNFNTSNVTNMYCMFAHCKLLTSLDVSNCDTSNVTDMAGMFLGCNNLTSLDVSGFDTSKVTRMDFMFRDCNKLTSLDVSGFNTDNVFDMNYMFSGCQSLTSLDVSNFNTSKVTNMISMFQNCQSLTSLDVSNFDTGNVTNMAGMFSNCQSLTSLDVSNWDTSKVTTMKWMFDGKTYGSGLKILNLNNFVLSQIYTDIIEDVILEKIYINDIDNINKLTPELNDRSSAETPGYIVTTLRDQIDEETLNALAAKNWLIKDLVAQYRYDANTYEDFIPEFNEEFTEDMYEVHDSVSEIIIDIQLEAGSISVNSGTDTGSPSDYPDSMRSKYINIIPNTTYMFNINYCHIHWYNETKTQIAYDYYQTDGINRFTAPDNAKYLRIHRGTRYSGATITAKLVTRSIESVNGDLPTLMRFGYNGNDTENHEYSGPGMSLLKINDMGTKELTSGYRMFKYCKRVTEIQTNWDTSNMTDMSGMFYYCNNLTSLDVSNWDTSKVTNMQSIFSNCQSLISLDVSNFNTSNVTNMGAMFYGCNQLTSLDVSNFDTSNVTRMDYMFYSCNSLTSLDVSNFDTSNVTNMYSMFAYCKSLTSLDVSNFDTSNVTRMDNMFVYCQKLTSLDVSNWDTSNVTNMSWMFYYCQSLISLDVSNFNTSKVVYMNGIFHQCYNLTSLDVSNWDTSNVTTMYVMFNNCYKLTSLDVSGFNTSKVTNMAYMFANCHNLTSLDVSNFNTSIVTRMDCMFNNCRALTSLDVSNFNTSNVTNMYAMFSDCANISSLELTNWDVSKVTDIQYFLDGLELTSINIKHLDLSFLELSSVTHMGGMFYKNRATVIKLPKVINSNLTSVNKIYTDGQQTRGMFYCTNLVSLDFGGLDISNVTDDKSLILEYVPKLRYIRTENSDLVNELAQYFPDRTEAEQGYLITKAEISDEIKEVLSAKYWNVVDLDEVGVDVAIYKFDKSVYKWMVPVFNNTFVDWFIDDVVEDEENEPNIVTRTIRSMGGLPTSMRFGDNSNSYKARSCCSLLEVDKLDVSEITTMNQMFRRCTAVTTINTVDWDTSNVNNMNELFYQCEKITSLDVSSWNTSNVNIMNSVFIHCFRLQSIVGLENWDTSNVQTMQWMFQDCQSLTSLDVSNWNTSKVTNMGSMFRYAISLTSLDVSNFDTSNVTNMACMFAGIDYGDYNPMVLESITFGENFNTSNVTSMQSMFYNCQSLTSLDTSNFNTINVTDMQSMFNGCNKLTSLDVSGFNTSNVTNMHGMFHTCQSLTSLDVSNWDTSKVTNMGSMFCNCYKLTSLDVSNFDTSNVTGMSYMFWDCNNLTSLDVSKWNTSKVNNMGWLFVRCNNLTSLDVSNFDTSNVTNMDSMFWECKSLTSLDASGFDTSNVTNMCHMFYKCDKLTSLDVSGFNTSNVTNMYAMFDSTTKLANIGMIYCDFKTVEKVAESIPTDNPTTIWVGRHIDFNALTPYDHITYKVYEVEDKLEAELSSPLLEGDRLEIIDGNLYHYHKMRYVELNKEYLDSCADIWIYGINEGSGNVSFGIESDADRNCSGNFIVNGLRSVYDGKMVYGGSIYTYSLWYHTEHVEYRKYFYVCLPMNQFKTTLVVGDRSENVTEFKNWMDKNNISVVYELANPYYELIQSNVGLLNAEQGLYLNISDSVIPVVNNQDLCTLKLNYILPNIQYKVKFKANNPGSVAINLGGTLVPLDVVEGWNEVLVTTPETLENEYLEVSGPAGIKIQNVMVIDSDKDFDYFKGINNTFDELEVKNICTDRTLTYTHEVDEEGVSPEAVLNKDISKGKVVTVIGKVSNNPDNLPISINLYNNIVNDYVNNEPVYIDLPSTAVVDEGVVDISTTDGYFAITIKADRDYANRIGFNVGDAFACEENDQVTITDLMVIEGDILDCHPTSYLDPTDSSYLAEFKSYNNPYGFGKNKLI